MLIDSGDKFATHVAWSLFGLLFFAAGVGVALAGGSTARFFIVVPFVLIGGGIAGALLVSGLRIRRFEPGKLVASSWPLAIGDSASVTFRRGVKRGAVPAVNAIEATIVVREVAQYRQGTDTHTVTEEVASYPVESRLLSTPDAVVAQLEVVVPTNAPPSFEADNNRIEWWLEIAPVVVGEKFDASSFKIAVGP